MTKSDEGVVASAGGAGPRESVAGAGTVDEWAARMVDEERGAPAEAFPRWRRARDAAVAALRAGDPRVPLEWIIGRSTLLRPSSAGAATLSMSFPSGAGTWLF